MCEMGDESTSRLAIEVGTGGMAVRRKVVDQMIATGDSIVGCSDRGQVGPVLGELIGDVEWRHNRGRLDNASPPADTLSGTCRI